MRYFLLASLAVLALSGCDRRSDNRGLLERFKTPGGPDELAILTQKPLQQPANLNVLPVPTPGQGSIADFDPRSDFVVAMTGSAPRSAGAAAADAALVAAVEARAGRAPDDGFAATGRVGGYEPLDPVAELERLRALGIAVPAAPPAN